MILWILKRYAGVKPVVIDGILYVLIAVFGSFIACITSDEAYKYINPYFIFYSKTVAEMGLAGASALKMFRSTSYSDHLDDKKAAQDKLENKDTHEVISTVTPQQTVTQTKDITNAPKQEDKQVGL